MDKMDSQTVWAVILSVCAAVVVIANAVEKVVKVTGAIKAPGEKQDTRISCIEARIDNIEQKLINDDNRLKEIKKGDRATQRALLALLDHGIDGNNIKQMQDAKEELNNYLIEK